MVGEKLSAFVLSGKFAENFSEFHAVRKENNLEMLIGFLSRI
jgi:hypothetical protein